MKMSIKSVPKWKRVIDLTCVLVSLPITIPIAVSIAAYTKLVSKGPIFFKQERIGHGCKPFTCYKFRSMNSSGVDTHKTYLKNLINFDIPMTKIDDKKDFGLIPGAKFLRSTGLDELPQLWNVVKGDMSIVGPRPCIRYEFEQFNDSHKKRFSVLPGLTGLWQVNGKNKTTFKKMIALDVCYANNVSPSTDIKIMAKTFPMLFNQTLNVLSGSRKEKTEIGGQQSTVSV